MRKLKRILIGLGMSLIFLLMFMEINVTSIITIVGFNWRGKVLVQYYMPSGKEIVLNDGEWRDIENVDFVVSDQPVMDNWAWQYYPDGHMRHTCLPDRHDVHLKFRQIDEFREQSLALVPLAVWQDRKDYFKAMKQIGLGVDEIILSQPLPDKSQLLYDKRRDKPRLRPFMAYLAYGLAGGKDHDLGIRLAALSEANNLHLYCHNYLLDNKRSDIQADRLLTLISSGQVYADLCMKLICNLSVDSDTKVVMMSRLAQEIDLTYQGQSLDANLTSKSDVNREEDYLSAYLKRSRLLSGPMYGFSIWSAYIAAGNKTEAENAYQAGQAIGLTFQLVNDIADYSKLKSDSLADWKQDKLTAPFYYLLASGQPLSEQNICSQFVQSGAFDSCLALVKTAAREAKDRLVALGQSDVYGHFLEQSLVVAKDNKFFRDLDSLRG